MIRALSSLANPHRFLQVSGPAAAIGGALAAVLLAVGLWMTLTVPEDYRQGDTVRLMFVHVPAAYLAILAYVMLAGASLVGLVWRSLLADCAARAAAPLGAAFTVLALVTGSLWGRPMWGTWWEWDARLTSVVVMFLFYLGYLAVLAAIEDETKAVRAAGVLALIGVVNLPIVKFSVDWWNTLHQPASVLRSGGTALAPVYLQTLAVMAAAYTALFFSLWLVRTRAELWRRRVRALQAAALA